MIFKAKDFEKPAGVEFPTIAVKGARISDFNGKQRRRPISGRRAQASDYHLSQARVVLFVCGGSKRRIHYAIGTYVAILAPQAVP